VSDTAESAFTAFRAAERLKPRSQPPWEVYGERLRRYEVHLNGPRVEMLRAPVELEGYGLRVFRRAEEKMGVGFAASTDLRDAGVEAALAAAEGAAQYARFPARRVELPGTAGGPADVAIVDRGLWDRPVESVERFVATLLAPFEGRAHEQPSFGSVRATLVETTLANSEGIQRRYHHTMLEVEIAVKATGGPEGAPPGEYWVNQRHRQVPSDATVRTEAERWIRLAQDVRRAKGPETGATKVVLPTSVLSDILPAIVGFRMSGSARLRKMMPPMGSQVGAPEVTIVDDGLIPHAIGTAPFDDEGVGQSRRPLVEAGVATGSIYDLLHASALGEPTGGNGRRDSALFPAWFRFAQSPVPGPTTLSVKPGRGGTDAELAEIAGDGLWVDQLGYAFPDPLSGAFGGEIRSAYRIRGGKIAEPVRGGTVGGVVFAAPGEASLLHSVAAIGRSTELVGGLLSPNWLVDGMTVAGA